MKPARFDYVAPTTLDAAVEALAASNGDGKILAGGQSLMPLLNFRMARPSILVDLKRIEGLSFIDVRGDKVVIGALTRHCEIERSPLIASKLPVMSAAMRYVAHLAIRNRGTIGGSLSHADPAAELPMLAVFYDATIIAQGPSGRRKIPAGEFFIDALANCLEPDEIVVEIEFPLLTRHNGWGFEEVSRRFGDFALACIAVSIERRGRKIVDARVAVMGVAETPLRLKMAERALCEAEIDSAATGRFADVLRSNVAPNTDIHASSDYRRRLVGALAEKALTAALHRAGEGSS
ncbi:FAD binding domain-containing protein [Bradyrhizobium canariense]|uniref:Carbon-monoxide dehydrogenase medium subunit n=1 Tax=Bradyrhizobium canariense TaxID=255045 RepID=A0A1H2BKP5_9BRAD|nr:xanthine dehydrogenase family protein subunit M [Bradyrhizobium canariense]SDT58748.1 carbon-monoxide dehydrogenase medium subunit [Bradyrhizobium canariense]